MKKKVIITGATSFIACHLVKEFLNNNYFVIGVIRPNSSNSAKLTVNDQLQIIELDMSNYMLLTDKITSADIFIHLAWDGVRGPSRNIDELQQKNHLYAIDAMKVASSLGCKVFLGVGSQAEYGPKEEIITELSKCNPIDAYGIAKLNTYIDLLELSKYFNMRFIWTRIFSLYGENDNPNTLIMTAIDKMSKNVTVELVKGDQLWDYLNVIDAVRAIRLLVENNNCSDVYNLASGECRPLKEYIEIIRNVLNSKSELLFNMHSDSVINNLHVDISKLKRDIKWCSQISFDEGISELRRSLNSK